MFNLDETQYASLYNHLKFNGKYITNKNLA